MRRLKSSLTQQATFEPLLPMRTYRRLVWCSLLPALLLCVSATLAAAQSPPGHARGISLEQWSMPDCMNRAKQALQVEGYTITWTGSDGYLGEKGANSAFILCDAGPEGKVLVNIVVAISSADRHAANAERDRLEQRVGNPTTAGPVNVIPADWTKTASAWRGRHGERFTLMCEANGTLTGSVWGTDVYTDDTSICRAAVHAGLITTAKGGQVTIEIRPGQAGYVGTNRNGWTSKPYDAWHGSFVFVR